jgi:hypothetical protein
MATLPVTLYQPIEYQDYPDVILQLNKSDFDRTKFTQGEISVFFSNCRFQNLTIENFEDIDFPNISLGFHNCLISHVEVENITSKNISISFMESIVKGRVKGENLSAIDFTDCLVPGGMFITGLDNVTVNFSEGFADQNEWQRVHDKLRLKGLIENFNTPNTYYIIDCKHIRFTTNGYKPKTDSLPKISLDLRYGNGVEDSETVVNGLFLQSFSLSGTPIGKVYIENLSINSWYIYNLHSRGDLSFYNIGAIKDGSQGKKIAIHRCILDNVVFDNIAFDDYPIVSFYRSKFSKARFTSCDFPDSYEKFGFVELENVHYPEKTPKNQDKALYEIFIQMKKSFEDSGNYHEAQKSQALSNEALRHIKRISVWDKTILSVNGWSNDHGLSIKKPLKGFFICSIPLYILYLVSIGRIFNCNGFDANMIGYFFSFVDITHRPDFLEKGKLNGWSLFIDYVGKLVVGFFIFQFIAAFRKYGKK